MPTFPFFYRRQEILDGFAVDTWQRKIFAEFSAALTSEARLFPCVFGVSGLDRDHYENGEANCGPGDVINLPAGKRHGSVALEGGAIYLIAMERKSLGDAFA